MAGHDRLHVPIQDSVARIDPVLDRAGPHDRVAAHEDDVAGEDGPLGGDVHKDVSRVCAGPTLTSTTRLSPTDNVSSFSKTRLGVC